MPRPRHNNRARNENLKEHNKNNPLLVVNVGQGIILASPSKTDISQCLTWSDFKPLRFELSAL